MMPKIDRTPDAKRDFREIFYYIAQDNVEAAKRLIQRFEQKLQLIASMPGIGADRTELRAGV
ncbi:MAG: type II toxin-antitoxin system RelE/ParE family toxin [Anaerolineae bacterium]|nr:type II toxin-antitoxin system RelE/ParE family toxin [Phycisphaerae bacterium]